MTEDEKFLSRWAKRKAEARDGRLEEPSVAVPDPPDAVDAEPEDPDDHPAAGIDIDSLDKDSDFTVFMHERVPEAIRRRALRKLWQSDPIFATLDGMNDYDDDFTDAATVVEGLKAAYDESVRRMKQAEAEEKARTSDADGQQDEAEEHEDAAERAPDDGGEAVSAADDEETTRTVEAVEDDLEDGTDKA